MIVNINNLRRVSCYHDKDLRNKADWIEKNNNFNLMHLMSDSFEEGRATREEIEEAYLEQVAELSVIFEALPIDENTEILVPYKQ